MAQPASPAPLTLDWSDISAARGSAQYRAEHLTFRLIVAKVAHGQWEWHVSEEGKLLKTGHHIQPLQAKATAGKWLSRFLLARSSSATPSSTPSSGETS